MTNYLPDSLITFEARNKINKVFLLENFSFDFEFSVVDDQKGHDRMSG